MELTEKMEKKKEMTTLLIQIEAQRDGVNANPTCLYNHLKVT